MRITINVLILILAISLNLQGQNSAIKGKAVYETSEKAIDSLKIDLLDSLENVIKSVFTDSLGGYKFENLEPGVYNLFTESNGPFPYKVTNILLEESQEIKINIILRELCHKNNTNGICPYCMSSRKVLKISPGMVVSLNFGENKKAERRYYRKIQRKGYKTYRNKNGEEVVISMHIESEKDKFYDFCHYWFCKKCKKVF